MLFSIMIKKYYSPTSNEGGGLIITMDNYEHYFLLYIDKEVSATEKQLVEAFMEQHPHTKVEFEALQATILSYDNMTIDKTSLFKKIIITQDNYLDYATLYIDNELTNEEKEAFNSFLNHHIDYKKEFDLLQKIKLVKENTISFNKSILYKTSHSLFSKDNTIATILTAYIDGETTAAQNIEIKKLLDSNPTYQTEFALLQKAKLPIETIIYPHKASLYRKEKEEKVRPLIPMWLRYAAAACFIFTLGWLGLQQWNKPTNTESGTIVKKDNNTPQPSTITTKPITITDTSNTVVTTQPTIDNNPINENYTTPSNETKNNYIGENNRFVKTTLIPKKDITSPVTNLPQPRNINSTNNKTVLSNNNNEFIAKQDATPSKNKLPQEITTLGNDAKATPAVAKNNIAEPSNIITTSTLSTTPLTADNGYEASNVTVMNIDAEKIDKQGKVKKARGKVGSFLQKTLSKISNGSVGIGSYEIAIAK
jgi:hypothetical protein